MEKLNKVARITALFGIIKILATTIVETLGDSSIKEKRLSTK